ncbi:uncharacterized protein RCC_00706 [Lecanosticta acicola]|uniref:Uncharacterized protein RCC_00706 n=1 Tax=Lecanosticta acicola TaxID=111012 RepID=A0AAI8W2I4_9PEZI|nr:uncharacterized protein RCC_00706 [Lecanosticta acicola]
MTSASSFSTDTRPGAMRVDSVVSFTQSRRASTNSGPYEAVVVGAGPAGITAVGNLLESRIEPVLWVDDAFNGGRVNKYYREVPSNTKVKLFIDFATAVTPFRKIVSGVPSRDRWEEPSASDGVAVGNKPDRLQDLRQLDAEKGCRLSHAADMCLLLTEGLKKTPGVVAQQGRVAEASLDESSQIWTINIERQSHPVQSKRIVLCTGASPTDPPLPVEPEGLEHLHLDTALSPTKLSQILSPLGPTTVAVIGASHSAVLVLMNLSRLSLSSKPDLKIKWFTRHPLRYAEYEESFIARDNTGLKGQAAQWAKDNLEPETLPNSPVSQCITKIAHDKGGEKEIYAEHLPGCAFVVQAIGYRSDPTPILKLGGEAITPVFDHEKGIFHHVKKLSHEGAPEGLKPLPGVYGAGIAFPERVVDRKYGHEEMNVGFFKFMKAVKKWVPGWKAVGGGEATV